MSTLVSEIDTIDYNTLCTFDTKHPVKQTHGNELNANENKFRDARVFVVTNSVVSSIFVWEIICKL